MSGLAARLQALEDRESIRTLIASYGRYADCGDAAGAAALWTDEGIYDVAGFGVHHGREAITALLSGDAHRALLRAGCAHILSAPVIELDGNHASATSYSLVLRHVGDVWEAHRVAANRWRFKRTDQGWRITERINRLLNGSGDQFPS